MIQLTNEEAESVSKLLGFGIFPELGSLTAKKLSRAITERLIKELEDDSKEDSQ